MMGLWQSGYAQNVGIGTSTPGAKLEVAGQVKITGGLPGDGKVLTSDENGLASWQELPLPPGTNDPNVSICCQRWMTKNLNVSTYRNGDVIPKVTDDTQWAALTTGAYCYYNNDSATYAATYGKLYNWYAVTDSRGLAPEGWYIPTNFEWSTLGSCLGGNVVAGGKMKETGFTHWDSPNTSATNLSGFTGLPGGSRNSDGTFANIGSRGYLWSVTESATNSNQAWHRYLYNASAQLYDSSSDMHSGYYVRCIRN